MATSEVNKEKKPAKKEKTARIEIRLARDKKLLLEQAAEMNGQSLSSFMLTSSINDAHRIIEDYNTIFLSRRDWNKFMDMIDNPGEPNEKLKQAMKKYQASKRSVDAR